MQQTPYIQELALKTAGQPEPKYQTPNSSCMFSYRLGAMPFPRGPLVLAALGAIGH